jgi:hypothetical protein
MTFEGIDNPIKERLMTEFSKLIDYYGGIVDFEMNMGTFWWENEQGQIYTMIVQGLDE